MEVQPVLEAMAWSLLAVTSLPLGAEAAFRLGLDEEVVGLLMAFGIGALVSSVAFELVEPALARGDIWPFSVAMAAGAVVFAGGDYLIDRIGGSSGSAIALGTLLDGLPETALLGMTVASGDASMVFLAGVWVSNFPEALGASRSMREGDRSRRWIRLLWLGIAGASVVAGAAGFLLASGESETIQVAMRSFGAGALLAMIVNTLAPSAYAKGAYLTGIVSVAGFLATTVLAR